MLTLIGIKLQTKQVNNKPKVTVIIATYNRPQVLKFAIKSVQSQSFKDWVLYVIGDNCNQNTKDLMDSISDEQIFYFNSPFRFGEQSGGNSIGVGLAKTEYIAYLNHDDIWTPDHLETALSELKKNKRDFYVGRCIFSNNTKNSIPQFKNANQINRKQHWTFLGKCMLFEPCSTWVIRTQKAKQIGYWKQKMETYRIPSQEYIMRAWHKRAKFIFGTKITCIMLTQHNNPHLRKSSERYAYDYKGPEHDYFFDLLSNRFEQFRMLTSEDKLKPQKFQKVRWITSAPETLMETWKAYLFHLMVNKYAAYLFYFTGIDTLGLFARCTGARKSDIEKRLRVLQRKTGENKMEKRNMKEVISYAKDHFPKNT